MKRMISLIALMLGIGAFSFLNAQNTTVLRFTGQGVNGSYVQLSSVEVQNLTQGWEETLVYPDTILMLGNVGIEDHVSITRFALSQNIPNPFKGSTDFSLQLPEADRVSISVMDLNGKKITDLTQELPTGIHIFRVILNTPQTYLVTAKTDHHSASIKIINQGSESVNRIEYRGMGTGHITFEMGGNKNMLSDHDFQPGDLMRYVGKYIADDMEYSSDTILQPQFESQDFTLMFPCVPLNVTMFNATTCNTFTWNGQTYSESGTYTQTFQAANGCDSIVTLNLIVNQPVTSTNSVTVCGSYVWNGQTYTQSGSYTQTFQTANGCDSVVTLNLTVNQPVTHSIAETVCGGYEWNGQTYTQSGSYTQTFTAANGCDSVVTLNLTVNLTATNSISATACGGYVWNGMTYTQTGIYTQTFTAANGCDSVVTLNLTVNQPVTHSVTETVCGGYVWNGMTYVQTGVYTQTFTAANGCDSVVTLNLTVNQLVLPVLSQVQVYGITAHEANVTASVQADECAPVLSQGFCWSTSPNPTITDSHTTDSSGTGEFSSAITGLTPGTTYYVRAYATNSVGTVYAEEIQFTTCEESLSIPYAEDFESYTTITTASTGIEPSCWELVQEDVTLTDATRPQLYYKSDFAHSGNYSLKLQNRCIYAMQPIEENITMKNIHLEMYLRQPNAAYRLQVGVWDDLTATFAPVATFNNSTANVEHVECDFSNYTGNGRRIAFRNVLSNGANYDYSYNYIDDITLTINFICGLSTVADHEGNEYHTISIGSQCWTKENLRTTTSPSTGIYLIPAPGTNMTFTGKQAFWYDNDSATYAPQNYGLLYNWNAAVDTFNTAYGETSVDTNVSHSFTVTFDGHRRGICPEGWHLPTNTEWNVLTDYLNSQSQYVCGNYSNSIAKALASTTGWDISYWDCTPGSSSYLNNASGFSAFPAGCSFMDSPYYLDWETGELIYNDTLRFFEGLSERAFFWSASSSYSEDARCFLVSSYDYEAYNEYASKTYGASVRCVYDADTCSSVSFPTVTTSSVSVLSDSTAMCGGEVLSDGGAPVIARGVCWNTSQNSTVSDNHTTDGDGMGSFASNITGLSGDRTFYVRAYATNAVGTAYGEEVSFRTVPYPEVQPCPGIPTVTDYDGNVYNTVQIGDQCWMRENLRTTHFADGTALQESSFTPNTTGMREYFMISFPFYYHVNENNDSDSLYGLFYNWLAVMNGASVSDDSLSEIQGICPNGWHVPSDADWRLLSDYASGQGLYQCGEDSMSVAKAFAATSGWNSCTISCAVGNRPEDNNALGFSALPIGYVEIEDYIYGNYYDFGAGAHFWSTTELSSGLIDYEVAENCNLFYRNANVIQSSMLRNNGLSVRCLRNNKPTVTTASVTGITDSSAACGGNVIDEGAAAVTARGVCWSTSPNPTLDDNYTTDGSGVGEFTSSITGLNSGTTYYVRAYATNSAGTAYGEEVTFTTTGPVVDEKSCPGTPTVTDIDGNIYSTVQIGEQCWMRENLRTTHCSDGTPILAGDTLLSLTDPYYYDYSSSTIPLEKRGYLYNWPAAMQACPAGWHLPSDAEWKVMEQTQTTMDVSGEGWRGDHAGRLAGGNNWNSSTTANSSGNMGFADRNASAFSAVPAGYWYSGFYPVGYNACFWTSTEDDSYSDWCYYRMLYYDYPEVGLSSNYKFIGLSVRCLRNNKPTVTTASVTGITDSSAVCGGNVIDEGVAAVTARGVCWSTSPNPTLDDNYTTDGSGTGEFTSSITGLNSGTTYYVRAYATNSAGTVYGEEVTFATLFSQTQVATIVLEAHNVWGDGSGYQLLLDADATAYGTIIPVTGPLTSTSDADPSTYAAFEYKIPQNADGSTYTSNMVYEGSDTIIIPAGIYDYCITNPTPGDRIWIASGDNARQDNYWFQGGYTYHFLMYMSGQGDAANITVLNPALPTVITLVVSNISDTVAICGGNVTDEGIDTVTARGVCWSTSPNPTLDDNYTTDGSGTGEFTSSITGLNSGTTYYVRAYATNSEGTAYGEEVTFTTTGPVVDEKSCPNIPIVTDVDGNIYSTVKIGEQCWLRENLRTTHCADGTPILAGDTLSSASDRYYYDYSSSTIPLEKRGYLYNWPAAMQACPAGWHLPSDAEWTVMEQTQSTVYLSGTAGRGNHAGKLAGGDYWTHTNVAQAPGNMDYADRNASGFSAFPAGLYSSSSFSNMYDNTYFWTSTERNLLIAYGRRMSYINDAMFIVTNYKESGLSVRCLRDGLPTVITGIVDNIIDSTALCRGDVTEEGVSIVSARGVCWSTSPNPTVNDNHTSDGSGTGEFTSTLTGLIPGNTYYVRAYATNTMGTAYGAVDVFTVMIPIPVPATDAQPCLGTPTVTDYDGNVYNTVKIGSQCWMKENLRTTKFADGTVIPAGSDTCSITPYYYDSGSSIPLEERGYLYNWPAVMHGESGSELNPSGVQGICPTGWHVPSNAEWLELESYVSNYADFTCDGKIGSIAKALASTAGWVTSDNQCAVGNNQNSNNATNFGAYPAGVWNGYGGFFVPAGRSASFWCATGQTSGFVYAREISLSYDGSRFDWVSIGLGFGFSVRCLRDTGNVGDTSTDSYLSFEVLIDAPCASDTLASSYSTEVLEYCVGTDTVRLSIGNYEYGIVQWQVSTDTVEWTDIENANDTVYVFYPEETAYYRAKMTYNWCSPDYSQTIHLNLIPRADAGRDRVQNAGQYVQLSGNAFEDATGLWTVLVGDSATIDDPTDPHTLFLGPDSLYVLTWTLTNSCGSSTDTMTIRYVPTQFADHIVVVDTTDLILSDSISRANGIYHIVFNTPVPTIADSTILVGIPYGGFLRKVVAFVQHGDTALMYTEQATLDDLIEEGAFNFDGNAFNLIGIDSSKSANSNRMYVRLDHQPTRAELSESPDFLDGRVWFYEYPMEYGFSDGSKSLNLNFELLNQLLNKKDTVNIIPAVSLSDFSLDPELVNDIDFYKHNGQTHIYLLAGMYLSYSFNVKFKSSFSVSTGSDTLTLDPAVNVTLTDITKRFIGFIGTVPVEFSAKLEVKGGLDGKGTITAEKKFKISGELGAAYELLYDNGDATLTKLPPRGEKISWEPVGGMDANLSVEAALSLTPKISLEFYGCLGPYFQIGPKASLKWCLNFMNGNSTTRLDLSAPWKLGLCLKMFKKKVFDLNYDDKNPLFTLSDPAYLERYSVPAEDYEVAEDVYHPVSFSVVSGLIPLSSIVPNEVHIQSSSGYISTNPNTNSWNMSELDFYVFAGDTINVYWKPENTARSLNGASDRGFGNRDGSGGGGGTAWGPSNSTIISVELRDCEGKHIDQSPMYFYVAPRGHSCSNSTLQLSEVNGFIRASGGTPPYKYSSDGINYSRMMPYATPDHTFYVQDSMYCETEYHTPPRECNLHLNYRVNGTQLRARAVDGTAPYSFYLDGSSSPYTVTQESLIELQLANGDHILSVKDNNGCSNTIRFTINDTKMIPAVYVNPTYNTYYNVWNEVQAVVVDDGNADITERGVYYSQSAAMTSAQQVVAPLGTGTGAYVCQIPANIAQGPYYVCAYAVNEKGTAYSDTVLISAQPTTPIQHGQPCPGTPTVTDYDGNVYNTVQIGNQCWTRENMRTTHYADGTAIPAGEGGNSETEPYYYDNVSNDIPLSERGYLYNWPAAVQSVTSSNANPSGAQGVCPTGWHVPSDAEWTQLTNYVSGQMEYICGGNPPQIAKALASETGWGSCSGGECSPGDQNVYANNNSGFSAIPAGNYYNGLAPLGYHARFWSSTPDSSDKAYIRHILYNCTEVYRNSYNRANGFSVRCLRDEDSPTVGDAHSCPGTPTVTDHEGNVYNTVQIGNQCWTRENMRCETSPTTGTNIVSYNTDEYSYTGKMAKWYDNDKSTALANDYGLLYNWNAAVDTFNVAYGETSVDANADHSFSVTFNGYRRGICPAGWHVPTDAEWTVLTDYLGSHSQYACGNDNDKIAAALASTTGWETSEYDECAVGYNPSANNTTGFSAIPAGWSVNRFEELSEDTDIWSATQNGSSQAYDRFLYYDNAYIVREGNYGKHNCFSVRCLRDEGSSTVQHGQPCPGMPTVTDYDGNIYNTVQIGNQCWTKENLRSTHYADGMAIPAGENNESDTDPYYYDYSNSNIPLFDRGYLYNWPAVMHGTQSSNVNPNGVQGICPTGWHVPSDAEWAQLTDYVSSHVEYICGGNTNFIAKALASSAGWSSSTNTCAVGNTQGDNNATGFSAMPAGKRYGSGYSNSSDYVNFWSSTEYSSSLMYGRYLNYNYADFGSSYNFKRNGYSVRCLRNEDTSTVGDAQPCPGTPTVTDYDGHVYNTVLIGNQCWTKENLRTTHYADGTAIPAGGNNFSYTDPYYYDYSSSTIPLSARGYLYNWPAIMHGAASSNANPSGVQGICPMGWHVPSDTEWTQLTDYLSSQAEYICGGNTSNIAKALASTGYWDSYSGECYPGDQSVTANNASGFEAVPAGNYCGDYYGNYYWNSTALTAYFWSYTEASSGSAWYRSLGYNNASVYRGSNYKRNGYSVRCLRDESGASTELEGGTSTGSGEGGSGDGSGGGGL